MRQKLWRLPLAEKQVIIINRYYQKLTKEKKMPLVIITIIIHTTEMVAMFISYLERHNED